MSENNQRVFVHVGVPKSGTTFLQSSLAKNRAALRDRGVLYPKGERDVMFRAALDVRGNHKAWGRTRDEVAGAWDEVCRKARKFEGTTVISHELLAAAGRHKIDSALSMLDGLEVHVVVTARDLARQATAEWQEGVKHGRTLTFAEFSDRVLSGDGADDHARRFAASQDLPDVLHRWSAGIPADRVHVLPCPEPGGDPTELWRMFGDLVGFDTTELEPAAGDRANSTLGTTQIDLLRRVNVALDRRIVQPHYGRLVKQWFAQDLLAQHPSPRPRLPLALYDDLVVVGERWVKEIDKAGWTVHGDVQRLVPGVPEKAAPHPDETDAEAGLTTATSLLAELLVELEQAQAKIADLKSDKKDLKRKRKSLKRRLADALDR